MTRMNTKIISKEDLNTLVYFGLVILFILSVYLLAWDGLIWLIGLTKAQSFWDGISSMSIKMRIGIFLFVSVFLVLYLYERKPKK